VQKCKIAVEDVCHFQHSKDQASTANLQHHAIQCFEEEAVQNGTKGAANDGTSSSIFQLFAHQGQKPTFNSYQSYTNMEV
jgi:hypothetical protein